MYYLNLTQSNIIIELLKKHSEQVDQEALLTRIQKDAKVSKELAELYLRAWKHNHKGGWNELLKKNVRVDAVDLVVEGSMAERTPEFELVRKAPTEPRTGSIIQQIIALHKAGKTNAEIIAAGFNKSTVGRQVSEYKKGKIK